jgi:hypothetical protein
MLLQNTNDPARSELQAKYPRLAKIKLEVSTGFASSARFLLSISRGARRQRAWQEDIRHPEFKRTQKAPAWGHAGAFTSKLENRRGSGISNRTLLQTAPQKY